MVSLNSFVCFFDNGAARDGVLAGGPWLLSGQVIGLDRWMPTFSASSLDGYTTPVWVRLPGLPLCCWDKINIARIISPLGLPLWIDAATNLLERGVFARACVKVDLSKPLKPGIWVHNALGSFYQPVEYEGLPVTCFRCGLVGHKGAACSSATPSVSNLGAVNSRRDSSCSPVQKPVGAAPPHISPLNESLDEAVPIAAPVSNSLDKAEQQEVQGLGPWMLVQSRRASRRAQSFGNQQQLAKHAKWVAIGDRSAARSSSSGRSQSLPSLSRRSGNISSLVASDRPVSATSMEGSPHLQASPSPPLPSSTPLVQVGPVQPNLEVGDCLQMGDGEVPLKLYSNGLEMAQSVMNAHDHAGLSVQQDYDEQLVFGGFKAMPVCREGPNAALDAVKLGARQRRGARLRGKAAAVPFTRPSSCVMALTDGSLSIPESSQCEDLALSSVQGLNDASSLLNAIVPYNNEDAIARMVGEGGKRKGSLSLKVDKMLNELGPISLSPRKRRMIVVPLAGGDASPSPPE